MSRLSEEEIELIVAKVTERLCSDKTFRDVCVGDTVEKLYAEVGRNVIRKLLVIIGVVAMALFAWLSGKGYVK